MPEFILCILVTFLIYLCHYFFYPMQYSTLLQFYSIILSLPSVPLSVNPLSHLFRVFLRRCVFLNPVRQRVLSVLFVSLVNPPTEVCIPDLPINVVPLLRTSSTIICSLPDNTHIRINRSQVEVLHNFAMTDYSSQGKTRPFNPVDLNNCRSHQLYYTALSRSATAQGTLMLPSLNSTRSSPINSLKIQGGCSGYLQQEFRELETLDDITT